MGFHDYLRAMTRASASDLYLISNAKPSIKVRGELAAIEAKPLISNDIHSYAMSMMNEEQKQQFQSRHDVNLALALPDIGRFRVNIYKQCNETAMVIRHIKNVIPDMKSLGLPEILKSLVVEKSGIILIVGATGVGKSTTLASMLDYRNQQHEGHILLIEEPIEFIHSHKKSIVTQREVGLDVANYHEALANAMRQAPDVVSIGEARDESTISQAIAFSQTGHLCLSTLHANNARQAFDRILHFYSESHREQLRLEIAMNLTAVISQRLVRDISGNQVPVFEILLGTPLVRDLICRNEISMLHDVMVQNQDFGMCTFDSSLYELFQDGVITSEEAMEHADSKNNLRIAITKASPNATPIISENDLRVIERVEKIELKR